MPVGIAAKLSRGATEPTHAAAKPSPVATKPTRVAGGLAREGAEGAPWAAKEPRDAGGADERRGVAGLPCELAGAACPSVRFAADVLVVEVGQTAARPITSAEASPVICVRTSWRASRSPRLICGLKRGRAASSWWPRTRPSSCRIPGPRCALRARRARPRGAWSRRDVDRRRSRGSSWASGGQLALRDHPTARAGGPLLRGVHGR